MTRLAAANLTLAVVQLAANQEPLVVFVHNSMTQIGSQTL